MLPFENLTGDTSLDWAGAAVSGIISSELSASTRKSVAAITTTRDAQLAAAGQIMRGYFERRGAELRFFAAVEDSATHRTVQQLVASAGVAGLAGAADSMARQTGERLRPFSTQNPVAVQAWGESLASHDGAARAAALKRAIQADPKFGTAYGQLVQLETATGNREGAMQVMEQARPRLATFDDLDRARLELLDAELSNRPEERRRALVAISRLVTTDSAPLQRLADIEMQRRDFHAAAEFLKNALALKTDDVTVLNTLGYAEANAGNLAESRTALERYRSLQPDQPNPLDSLGETSFILGQFEEAEKYFLQAQSISPGFLGGIELAKAGQARLMRGDVKGADELYLRYVGPIDAAHPLNGIRVAQWQYLTGRRKEAIDAIAKTAGPAVPYAEAQQTVWAVAANSMDVAEVAAAGCAPNPTLSALCRGLLGSPASVPGALGETIRVYRMIGHRDFKAALPELKRLYERADPLTDGEIRTLYAWALAETGNMTEAAKLVEAYPLFIGASGDVLLKPFMFPRFLAVRAAVRQHQGKTDEASKLSALYRQYAGEPAGR